jgi:hypothetical protein
MVTDRVPVMPWQGLARPASLAEFAVESQLPATPGVGELESDLFPVRLAEYGLIDDEPAVILDNLPADPQERRSGLTYLHENPLGVTCNRVTEFA